MRFFLIFCFCILSTSSTLLAQVGQRTGEILIPFRQKNHWGFCDTLGRIVIQPYYDSAGFFSGDRYKNPDELALVSKDGRQGAIDKEGNVIIDLAYDAIKIDDKNKFCLLELEGKKSISSLKGQIIIPPNYSYLAYDALANGFIAGRNGKMSLRDLEGRVLAPMIYDTIFTVERIASSQNLVVGMIEEKKYRIFRNGKREIIDPQKEPRNNIYLLPDGLWEEPENEEWLTERALSIKQNLALSDIDVETYKVDGYFIVRKDQKVGLIRHDQARTIPIEYDSILDVYCSDSIYEGEGGNYWNQCLIKKEGVCMDLFWVEKNGKFGIIDHNNEIVLPLIYDGFKGHRLTQPILDHKLGKIYFDGKSAKIKFECIYEALDYDRWITLHGSWIFSIYKVKKDGKWGYLGENGIEFFQN